MSEHGGSRETERKRDRRGNRKALTRKDGEGRNSVTGEQDKPVDPSLFSHGYRISNGGQETPPYQAVIIEND